MSSEAVVRAGQAGVAQIDMTPRSLEESMAFAEKLSQSKLVPQGYQGKPNDILVAMQYGYEIGLAPMQALSSIAVINGRACLWGDGALAVVQKSGLMENFKEMTADEIRQAERAIFWAKRRGVAEPIIREFSVADAKKAGLWGKTGPWSSYPYRMLQMRARSWGLRDGFSDALKGLAIGEEIQDVQPTEAPRVLAMPRRLSESRPEPEALPEPVVTEPEQSSDPADGPKTCEECGSDLAYHPDGQWGPWWSCSKYKETCCSYKISLKKWIAAHPAEKGA